MGSCCHSETTNNYRLYDIYIGFIIIGYRNDVHFMRHDYRIPRMAAIVGGFKSSKHVEILKDDDPHQPAYPDVRRKAEFCR